MGEIRVRMGSEADALTLARLRYEFRSSFHQVREDESAFVDRCTVWMRQRLRSDSLWKCWIAELQDTAVGDVWIQLVEKIPNPIEEPEYYIYLTNFYVREQYRSHGVGSMMLSEILDWVKRGNIKTVILWPSERSKAFYIRHGFATTEELMQFNNE